MLILMPTGQAVEILEDLLRASVFIRENHSFLGNAKRKKGSQSLPPNLNIVLCPLLAPRFYGFVVYF